VSFVGTGDEDWVELDFDLFERSTAMRLDAVLVDRYRSVVEAVGTDFEVESSTDGLVYLVVEGTRRYRAEIGRNDRLILTGILDPDGPL
jgi:hypothetical protein